MSLDKLLFNFPAVQSNHRDQLRPNNGIINPVSPVSLAYDYRGLIGTMGNFIKRLSYLVIYPDFDYH